MQAPSSKKIREEGIALLQKRAERLVKLLALDAPDEFLQREAHLVMKAGAMLSPQRWKQIEAEGLETELRRLFGLCSVCDEQAGIDGAYCSRHEPEIPDDLAELLPS